MITIYIAGTMQGSNQDGEWTEQSWRDQIKDFLRGHPDVQEVVCPTESFHIDNASKEQVKEQFRKIYDLITLDVDLVVAVLPSASMGTAIEMMWARKARVPVWAITPMDKGWAIMFLSHKVSSNPKSFMYDFDHASKIPLCRDCLGYEHDGEGDPSLYVCSTCFGHWRMLT